MESIEFHTELPNIYALLQVFKMDIFYNKFITIIYLTFSLRVKVIVFK